MSSIVVYYRQSTKKQERSGLGLEAQRSTVRKHINDTNDAVIGTYTETKSGTKSDRPELARALDHARNAGATLVVAKLDRLARNLAFLDQVEKSRVAFTALDMPGAGKFQLQMMMAFAEEEARQIRSRTQKALAERRKNGSPMGAEHPNSRNLTNEAAKRGRAAGLIERRRLSNAEYHFILPDMADWRDREKLSLRAIANRLNGMKRRTIQGKPWTAGTVANVLGRAEL